MDVEIIKNKYLTEDYKNIMNKARISNWGKSAIKNFYEDYEPETIWFFVKDNNKIVSFGGVRPLRIKFMDKIYDIGGICSTISIKKGMGYGSVMINEIKKYSKESKKTLLGFTVQSDFFRKVGLKVEKKFIERIVYKKEDGSLAYDDEGDGVYIEGDDKLILKILKNNETAFIFVDFW